MFIFDASEPDGFVMAWQLTSIKYAVNVITVFFITISILFY